MVADDNIYASEHQLLLDQFGATVKRLRHDKDMSQEELADRAGLHRTEISLLERGLRNPRFTTLLQLARDLDVSLTALVDHVPVPEARDNRPLPTAPRRQQTGGATD